jgi:hypothetical protein
MRHAVVSDVVDTQNGLEITTATERAEFPLATYTYARPRTVPTRNVSAADVYADLAAAAYPGADGRSEYISDRQLPRDPSLLRTSNLLDTRRQATLTP